MSRFEDFLTEHKIEEVECLLPDMSGIARGKILPADKFLKGMHKNGLRIPEGIFLQTVTGDYSDDEDKVIDPAVSDVYLTPDADTIRLVPWYEDPTAQVICDAYYFDGKPVEMAARGTLKRILKLFEDEGWFPIVAPELEFYLVDVNADPDYPLVPPIGTRSQRRETGRQSYSVDAVNEFDPLFEDVYDYCEVQGLDVDTLTHEAGAAQMEMNFNHGAPLHVADQTFLFKRTVREVALRHKVYATFMAKPMQNEPGSSMHIHQSLLNDKGKNLFSTSTGKNTKLFQSYVAGLQKYMPAVMPLVAPNVNSYRRLIPDSDAPINTHWGLDNRTVGLRVPHSEPQARRVENRIAGADANPYLAFAATLACGYLGMTEGLKPRPLVQGSAYRLAHTLPRTLYDALHRFTSNRALKALLGEQFVEAVNLVKDTELLAYQKVISSWEREHLLLNV